MRSLAIVVLCLCWAPSVHAQTSVRNAYNVPHNFTWDGTGAHWIVHVGAPDGALAPHGQPTTDRTVRPTNDGPRQSLPCEIADLRAESQERFVTVLREGDASSVCRVTHTLLHRWRQIDTRWQHALALGECDLRDAVAVVDGAHPQLTMRGHMLVAGADDLHLDLQMRTSLAALSARGPIGDVWLVDDIVVVQVGTEIAVLREGRVVHRAADAELESVFTDGDMLLVLMRRGEDQRVLVDIPYETVVIADLTNVRRRSSQSSCTMSLKVVGIVSQITEAEEGAPTIGLGDSLNAVVGNYPCTLHGMRGGGRFRMEIRWLNRQRVFVASPRGGPVARM